MNKEAKAISHAYILPISVPSEMTRTANETDLLRHAMRLVLLSASEKGSLYWGSEDGKKKKLILGPRVTDDKESVSISDLKDEFESAELGMTDILSPAEDARFVLANTYYRNGKNAEQTKDSALLDRSRQMVRDASDKILARFGKYLSSEQRVTLNLLDQGVNVIPKLKDTDVDLSSFLDNSLLPRILQPFIRTIVDLHGEVSNPYIAVNFDEDYLKSSVKQEKKIHTAVHEALHVIGSNNLPMLLDEAITDDLADEALGYSSNSQNRMGESFKYVCKIWQRIKAKSSIDLIIAAYAQPAIIRKTVDTRSKETISLEYLDQPFHDQMREIFGKDGESFRWDLALGLIDNKKGREAYNCLFPGEKKMRRFMF